MEKNIMTLPEQEKFWNNFILSLEKVMEKESFNTHINFNPETNCRELSLTFNSDDAKGKAFHHFDVIRNGYSPITITPKSNMRYIIQIDQKKYASNLQMVSEE